ncbi:MAG TPA: outer membrane beta-barrel protein, partial [Chitinophagaceae bacterium]|nr:outer membrane beta-barrel protein [Chitinophagaceae bacterium]
MKKILAFIILMISLLYIDSQAQTKTGTVSGSVIDGNAKTIESATITLLRSKDSSVAKISVANKAGNFLFEDVADGSYLVTISAVGHTQAFSKVFEINQNNLSVILPVIELKPSVKSLDAVTVTTRKPLIEQKVDRTIVNVASSVTAVGNTALEVLEKSPGVTVDKDGNISLKGKLGVVIMLDGRPSYLSGADLANLLSNMSASQLDQIEIMTNPRAKYDAAGNSGIINIKTKKTKQFGLNGNLSSAFRQAYFASVKENANLNYRNDKFNLFTSLNYGTNIKREGLDISRNFLDQNTKTILSVFDQKAIMKRNGKSFSAKAGLDYYASKKTTLGFVLSGFSNSRLNDNKTYTDIFDPQNVLLKKTAALSNNDSKWKNFSANGYFKTVLDSTGQEISADFDYIQYRSTNIQPLISFYYDNNGQLTKAPDTLNGNLPQDITIYSAKTDYTKQFKNGAKLEAGLKFSFVKTDNNANYDTLRNGQQYHDYNRSNHFVYEENVSAAYV